MNRARLQHLLTTALFSAVSACGGSIADPAADGGADGGADTAKDAASDTAADARSECDPTVDNSMCNESATYPCGLPIKIGATPTTEECKTLCAPITFSGGFSPFSCWISTDDAGKAATVHCASCAVGRKPADLLGEIDDGTECEEDPVARALAEMARVEAASVHAFHRLEATLAGLGADQATLGRVRSAADDEIAHARLVSRLARARGAAPRRVRFDPSHVATVYELARENAVEGCVHETLGVAYLAHQREHAADPELRAMAAALYEDELDHAALSWDLVGFFEAHLNEAEQARIEAEQVAAFDAVVEEIGRIDPRVSAALGLPPKAVVGSLVSALRGELRAARFEAGGPA